MEQEHKINFGQDEVKGLHIGLLLFNRDFFAIKDALLPNQEIEDIVQFYCNTYTYTKAHAHVQKLELLGFQPGSLVSGNMRNRVLRNISAATGRCITTDRTIAAAFKSYDACSLPLVDLVEALTGAVGPAAFARAVYDELRTVGVDMAQMTLSEVCLDWDALEDKVKDNPAHFQAAIWPSLANAGWKQGDPHHHAPATAGDASSQAAPDASPQQPTQQHTPEPWTSSVAAAPEEDGEQACLLYIPPASVAADYAANVGEPLETCRSPAEVLDAMREAGQAVPATCILSLREAEFEGAVRSCLIMAGREAPHRHVHDPSAKRPGTPTTCRKFMCANCGINTSTVWRTGNAGLTLCNACGMFYNKHDHEHRPEHLIASARAKQEAQQAAAAAAGAANSAGGSPGHHGNALRRGSFMRGYTPDTGHTDGEMSDDAGMRRGGSYLAGSESGDDDDDGVKRPRTRRRAQVNKWLASDDYLMLDGPLRSASNPDFAAAACGYGGGYGTYGQHDDGRYAYDAAQRARYTASPNFPRHHHRRAHGHQRHGGGFGDAGYGRSRSVDPEYGYERWQQQQGQDDAGQYHGNDYGRQYGAAAGAGGYQAGGMDWEDDGGAAGYAEEEEGEGGEGQQQQERPFEDMESLLGRILLNSPSDASDSSAADALVAMSQSCISQQEQHRLHAAISCDIRAASGSPGPISAPPRSTAATAAVAGGDASPVTSRQRPAGAWAAASREGAERDPSMPQVAQKLLPSLAAAADADNDADSGMEVDAEAAEQQEAEGPEQGADGPDDQATAEVPEDGFAKAWARVQAMAQAGINISSNNSSRGSEHRPQSATGFHSGDASPAAWFQSLNQSPLQHCRSAPGHCDADGSEGLHDAAAAAGPGSYSRFGSTYGQQQYQHQHPGGSDYFQDELLAPHSLSGPPPGSLHDPSGLGDSGSRSASPIYAGRAGAAAGGSGSSSGGGSSHRSHGGGGRGNRHSDGDGDYQPEGHSKGKGRSISRFGAEHKQQMDHYTAPPRPHQAAAGPHKPRSPMPHRSIRRTSTGEPVRCANCASEHTCLWRRDKEDPTRTLCNACGIYKTNNGIDRPTNGLFPFMKNGKERVVRRNTARPCFKPYRHQVLTAEEYKAQRQQDEFLKHSSTSRAPAPSPAAAAARMAAAAAEATRQLSAAARYQHRPQQQQQEQELQPCGDIHPGALGLPEPQRSDAGSETHSGTTPAAAAEQQSTADMPRPSPAAAVTGTSNPLPRLSDEGVAGSSSSAALSAAMAAATAAVARARAGSFSGQLNRAGSTVQQPAGVLAAPPEQFTSTAGAAAAEAGGSVHQLNPGDVVVGSLIHQAWMHAKSLGQPVLSPTGHNVFPDGKVTKCQINNNDLASALMLPGAGSQEIAASVVQVAAAALECGSSTGGVDGLKKHKAAAAAEAAGAAEGTPSL